MMLAYATRPVVTLIRGAEEPQPSFASAGKVLIGAAIVAAAVISIFSFGGLSATKNYHYQYKHNNKGRAERE